MTEKQAKYNAYLKKLEQAEQFLYNNQKDLKILDYLSKFRKACSETDKMIKELGVELGREMTDKEILLGF
jgi:hypothetical protein